MITRDGEPEIRATIGITMGDPSGIGSEVIVKALDDPTIAGLANFVIYGNNNVLLRAARECGVEPCWHVAEPVDATNGSKEILLADFALDHWRHLQPKPSKEGGLASLEYLDQAIADAKSGQIDALVTGPIHKQSWRMAGCKFPGHTEKLASDTGASDVSMLFCAESMRLSLATVHVPLMDIRNVLTIGCVFRAIDHLGSALSNWWGIEHPVLAVAGLNPHCGEGGQFGDEEARIIEPAMEVARHRGWDVRGPFPADSLFAEQNRAGFHGIVAMYHDQGLIPIKLLAFNSAVNLTYGLPFPRTSVDHGTAFDIVRSGAAHPGSMQSAIVQACDIVKTQFTLSPPRKIR